MSNKVIPEDASFTDNEVDAADEGKQLHALRESNRKKLRVIDKYIDQLWSKRVLVSAAINACVIGMALYDGMMFVYAVIFSAVFHTLDKYIDYCIHRMYQKKDYARYG